MVRGLFITPLEVTAGVGLVGAGLAFRAAMLNLRQKAANDRRDAWWKRAQWAIDHSLSADPQTRTVGTEAMRLLALDPTASPGDLDVLDAALQRALDTPQEEAQDGLHDGAEPSCQRGRDGQGQAAG